MLGFLPMKRVVTWWNFWSCQQRDRVTLVPWRVWEQQGCGADKASCQAQWLGCFLEAHGTSWLPWKHYSSTCSLQRCTCSSQATEGACFPQALKRGVSVSHEQEGKGNELLVSDMSPPWWCDAGDKDVLRERGAPSWNCFQGLCCYQWQQLNAHRDWTQGGYRWLSERARHLPASCRVNLLQGKLSNFLTEANDGVKRQSTHLPHRFKRSSERSPRHHMINHDTPGVSWAITFREGIL